MDSVEEILGEQFKNLTVAPMYGLINKLKLDEKFKVFESVNTPYLMKITKKSEDDVPMLVEEEGIDFSKPLDKPIDVYVNGMYNDFKDAKANLLQHVLKRNSTDIYLNNMKIGEEEYLLFHNETRGFARDVIECCFDKFGVKGNNHLYSNAAQQLGEMLFRNKGNFSTTTMFSQGNIQWRAGLEYIEEKYGEGVLKEIITKRYHSLGSPYNAKDLIMFLRNKEMIKNPNSTNVEIKNDNLDIVANAVGFNGMSIVSRDDKLQDKINKGIKYGIWEPHSSYTAGTKITTEIKYRAWQLPLIGVDKILRLFNPKEYFDKEKYNPTINKGVDENDKK